MMISKGYYNVSMYDPNNFKQLDSLRGIMAVLILGCHYFATFSSPWPSWGILAPFSILGNATLGLCYFFVLSGLVISYSLQKKQSRIFLWKYIINRYLRLLPPIFFSILLMYYFQKCALFSITDEMLRRSSWASQLYIFQKHDALINPFFDIFYNSYIGGNVYYNCNLWAIRYEFLVPLLIVLVNPYVINKKVRLCINITIILLIVLLVNRRWFYLASMLLGMQLCYYIQYISELLKKYNTCGIVLLLAIWLVPHLFSDTFFRLVNLFSATFLVVFTISNRSSVKKRLLGHYVLCMLGKVSYEIYVFHIFFIFTISPKIILILEDVLNYNFAIIVSYMFTIVITFVFSYIFHKYISINFGKLKIK